MNLRIDEQALNKIENQYYYENNLFTGISYKLSGDFIKEKLIIKNGIIIGSYKNAYFPENLDLSEINAENLVSEYINEPDYYDDIEPYHFNGKPFTGFAYGFNNMFCTSETYYDNGFIKKEMSWDESSLLRTFEVNDEDINQDIAWYPDGSVEHIKYDSESLEVKFVFTESHQLKTLILNGDYFKTINDQSCKLLEKYLMNKTDAMNLNISESFFIEGSLIDDEFINYLLSGRCLDRVKNIVIYNTGISEMSIKALEDLSDIEKLSIVDAKEKLFDSVSNLKRKYPSRSIDYNREEIIA